MSAADSSNDVRAVIRRQASLSDDVGLPDDLALGSSGLGLDSVAIVELLLACELACGVRLGGDVFESTGVTVGALVSAVREAGDSQ